jgi:hypothetical protein
LDLSANFAGNATKKVLCLKYLFGLGRHSPSILLCSSESAYREQISSSRHAQKSASALKGIRCEQQSATRLVIAIAHSAAAAVARVARRGRGSSKLLGLDQQPICTSVDGGFSKNFSPLASAKPHQGL